MTKKLQTILYVLINSVLFILPSLAYASIADIQKNFNTSIRSEIMNSLSSTALGWGGLGGQIFAVCFTVAMIQAFQKFGPEMLMSLVSLGLKSWVVMALVGGPTYSSEVSRSLFGQPGSGSLDLDLFNFLAGFGDDYADRLSLVNGLPADLALAAETAKINVFVNRMFKASKECKSDAPIAAYTGCVDSVIKTGNPPATQEPSKGIWEKLMDGNILSAMAAHVMNIISVITQVSVFIYTGIFPFVLMLLTLIRFGANMCIFIILGLTTAVSMMLAKIIVPFYLLKQFEGTVIKSVKVPLSAALYGFAQAIVILLGYAIMKGVNQAANEQFVSSMTSGTTGSVQMAAEMINMFAALYITQALVVIMQIMALLKIPSFCQDLLNLQLGNFVKFGEELFKAGVGMLGTVAQISMAVASGGAALGGMLGNFAGLGGMMGKFTGAAKGLSSGLGKGISSRLNNSALGRNIASGSTKLKDRFESKTGYSLSGPSSGVSVDGARTSRGGGGSDVSSAASGLANESMFPKGGGKGDGSGGGGSQSSGENKGPSLMDKAKEMGKDFVKQGFAVGAGSDGNLMDSFVSTGLGGVKMINSMKESQGQTAMEKASNASALQSQMWVANKFSAAPQERLEALQSVRDTISVAPKTILSDDQQSNLGELLAKENLTQAESDQVSSYMANNILSPDQSAAAQKSVSDAHMAEASRLQQGRTAYSSTADYQQAMDYVFRNKNRDLINNSAKTQTKSLEQSNRDYASHVKTKEKEVQTQIQNIQSNGFGTQGSLLSAQMLMNQYSEGAISKDQLSSLSSTVAQEDQKEKALFERNIQDTAVKASLGTLTADDMLKMRSSIESNKSYLVGNNDTIKSIEEIRSSVMGQLHPIDLSFKMDDYKAELSAIDASKLRADASATKVGSDDYSYNIQSGKIETAKMKINKDTGEQEVVTRNGVPVTEEATTVKAEFVDSLNKELGDVRRTRSLMESNKEAYVSRDDKGELIQASQERYEEMTKMLQKREEIINKALEQVAELRAKKDKK